MNLSVALPEYLVLPTLSRSSPPTEIDELPSATTLPPTAIDWSPFAHAPSGLPCLSIKLPEPMAIDWVTLGLLGSPTRAVLPMAILLEVAIVLILFWENTPDSRPIAIVPSPVAFAPTPSAMAFAVKLLGPLGDAAIAPLPIAIVVVLLAWAELPIAIASVWLPKALLPIAIAFSALAAAWLPLPIAIASAPLDVLDLPKAIEPIP